MTGSGVPEMEEAGHAWGNCNDYSLGTRQHPGIAITARQQGPAGPSRAQQGPSAQGGGASRLALRCYITHCASLGFPLSRYRQGPRKKGVQASGPRSVNGDRMTPWSAYHELSRRGSACNQCDPTQVLKEACVHGAGRAGKERPVKRKSETHTRTHTNTTQEGAKRTKRTAPQ